MDPDLHTIACLGFKGGSGRTTTSAALAFGLAAMGQRVALVDAGFAVPLQERFLGQERGFGAPPEHSTLSQWIDAIQVGPTGDGYIQYIRASTVGYLESVLDQLWNESWTYAVIDTPAHQTASVFEAVVNSAILLLPARSASDAKEVKDRLPREWLIEKKKLKCVVAGSERSKTVRAAFAPLSVLTSELPYDQAFSGFIPHQPHDTSGNAWQDCCVQLAQEVMGLISEQQDLTS